jgi:hypothetical protein
MSTVYYVLAMSLLYANANFRKHFCSNKSTQSRTKLIEHLCRLLSNSCFPLEIMVIEVQNQFTTEGIRTFNYYSAQQLLPEISVLSAWFNALWLKHGVTWKLTLLLSLCVGNPTDWWTTQDELFWVTPSKYLQVAAADYHAGDSHDGACLSNSVQRSDHFTLLEACLSTTVLNAYRVHQCEVFYNKQG